MSRRTGHPSERTPVVWSLPLARWLCSRVPHCACRRPVRLWVSLLRFSCTSRSLYGNATSSNTLSVHRTPSRGGDLFALTVFGDSMIDAAICYGGVGTVRRPDSADQGDLVAGLLEDKAKVKVLRRQDGQVWLMPRTPSCSPIPGDEAQILGKVLGALRLLCGSDPHRFLPAGGPRQQRPRRVLPAPR